MWWTIRGWGGGETERKWGKAPRLEPPPAGGGAPSRNLKRKWSKIAKDAQAQREKNSFGPESKLGTKRA